jgi:hypothetical protein
MLYDLFICHASEDKESFVRPLAKALAQQNVEVWYDEFSLKIGDSIRRAIDTGLTQSRFGIIVISPAFFEKRWPQYELDGLIEIEMRGRDKVILPIWHGVTHFEVVAQSPSLANRVAVLSSRGLDSVVSEIMKVVRPQGSPLIVARDLLLEWDVVPPVITDPYWLEITEASNRVDAFGASVPDESVWGRWTFPLPSKEGGPQQWGQRLAWTALQLDWSNAAETQKVTPITPPNEVHKFIHSQPGLFETCELFPDLLIEYAPQLVIPGMSGEFDTLFSTLYEQSIERHLRLAEQGNITNTSRTNDEQVPLCDLEWALRNPELGRYSAEFLAESYFSSGMFGPPVSPYEHIDHLTWLLSDASNWIPNNIHDALLSGMASWRVWLWRSGNWSSAGAMADALLAADRGVSFRWSPRRKDDVLNRMRMSILTLGLPDEPQTLLERFIRNKIPLLLIQENKEFHSRR